MNRNGNSGVGPMILVVDDDRGLARLMEKKLQREGFSTASAASFQEAVDWLADRQPDLMLLDLKLEDIGGQELIDHLMTEGRSIPFVIITGQGDERVAVAMMKRGAMDYLVKDVDFLEFLPEVVKRALRQLERDRKLADAEDRLRKENAFTSAMLDTSAALVVVLDRLGRIVRFNPACEHTTGYSSVAVKGKRFWDLFLVAEEIESVKAVFDQLLAGNFPNRHENYWRTRTGEKRLIAWSNSALLADNGSVEYVVSTGIDVTDRRRLEQEILQISEMEQHRIGQDLHDGLCQHLAATELMSQILAQRLVKKSKAEAERAADIASQVREAISQTRALARGLSPVVLESEGLMSALQELAAYTEKMFRVDCHFQCAAPVLIHDHDRATHLYRIAQEAISNAIRHGKSKHITISLTQTRGQVRLTVKDDGTGLPPNLSAAHGMGLRIMRYRAAMINGSMDLENQPGGGASVTCSVQPEPASTQRKSHEKPKSIEKAQTPGADR